MAKVLSSYLRNSGSIPHTAYCYASACICVTIRYKHLLKWDHFNRTNGAWVQARFISGAIWVQFPAVSMRQFDFSRVHFSKTSFYVFPTRPMRSTLHTARTQIMPILADTKRVLTVSWGGSQTVESVHCETDQLQRVAYQNYEPAPIPVAMVYAADPMGHSYLIVGKGANAVYINISCTPLLSTGALMKLYRNICASDDVIFVKQLPLRLGMSYDPTFSNMGREVVQNYNPGHSFWIGEKPCLPVQLVQESPIEPVTPLPPTLVLPEDAFTAGIRLATYGSMYQRTHAEVLSSQIFNYTPAPAVTRGIFGNSILARN